MTLQRRTFIQVTAAGVAVGLPASSGAQTTWPARTVKIVVPFTPGGATDAVPRLVGVELSTSLGQSVVVENRPGAGTVIGVDAVTKAPPDGYTFVCVANSFAVNQTLVKRLPYHLLKDPHPVASMGMSEHVLATHPGIGIRTLADLQDRARAKPRSLSLASFGNGTSAHLAGEFEIAKYGDMVRKTNIQLEG